MRQMPEQRFDLRAWNLYITRPQSLDESADLITGVGGRTDDLVIIVVPATFIDLLRLVQPKVGHHQGIFFADAVVERRPRKLPVDAGERLYKLGKTAFGLKSSSKAEAEEKHHEQ